MSLPINGNGNGIKIGSSTLRRMLWHAAQLAITLFVAGVVWARLEYKVDAAITECQNDRAAIQEMDKNGTRRSHETDANQQIQIDTLNKRVDSVEKALGDLGPKVDRIDTNVLWLMSKEKNGFR